MKKILLIAAVALLATTTALAQRRGCVHDATATRANAPRHIIPTPTTFDPSTTYRQPVLLVEFSNLSFSMPDPVEYYKRLFNEPGYNEGAGPGCVADYFREQSGGCLNISFDIYGPVKISSMAGTNENRLDYGTKAVNDAGQLLSETVTSSFMDYDWNGDSRVDQLIVIFAGYSGSEVDGYIWPNTSYILLSLPGNIRVMYASISCEMWEDDSLCGIGTIVHEFCHCLGLPDLYPTTGTTAFSVVDEWDLMDGGNYTNNGWCPPNLSAFEKMYLGWNKPVKLTTPTSISGLMPASDGGKTYIVRNSAKTSEYYLLENRRQTGWDLGLPGHGLLISHVDYDKIAWQQNNVNTNPMHYRYDLFHADGKDYEVWDPLQTFQDPDRWTMDYMMRSTYLSTTPYPYTDPLSLAVNDALTDDSSPAAILYNPAADGRLFMGKPITNIQQAADGTISFDFMGGGDDTGIHETREVSEDSKWFDLSGRQLCDKPAQRGIYIHGGRKVILQ